MRRVSEKSKMLYLLLLIFFLSAIGIFWLDYIGLLDISNYARKFRSGPDSVMEISGDVPSLVQREEFLKEKERLAERIEDLDKREALLAEREGDLNAEKSRLAEIKKGLELERKKLEDDKKKYSGYRKNVEVLADKMGNMPPDESVKIMEKWEDPLIIDVLRQMDADALTQGRASITAYLITLFQKEKASRILYLMTQL